MNPNDTIRSSRRHFLASHSMGLGGVALAWLLKQDALKSEEFRPELTPTVYDLTPKAAHHPPRANAMISMFMQGGPSHLDLLDPKPILDKYNVDMMKETDGSPGPMVYSDYINIVTTLEELAQTQSKIHEKPEAQIFPSPLTQP